MEVKQQTEGVTSLLASCDQTEVIELGSMGLYPQAQEPSPADTTLPRQHLHASSSFLLGYFEEKLSVFVCVSVFLRQGLST